MFSCVQLSGEYACVNAPRPLCDDGIACTVDSCVEATGYCSHRATGPNCRACSCTPDCAGKVCGDDGCGGSCGTCSGLLNSCAEDQKACVQCIRNCTGRTCGTDGCSGSCGSCAAGRFCNVAGSCVLDPPGSCGAPIDISAQAQAISWNGRLYFEDDNSRGINQVRCYCCCC